MSLKIRDGSVKTLWRLSLPLILSLLSAMGMVTIDRLFLARYSAEALSAAASGGLAAWAFTYGGQTLANVAGIFVAQYNGAEREKEIGRPIWQMIWLSLWFALPFGALALWLGPWIFAGSPIASDQVLYYRWTLAISPLMCLLGGLNGFFVGRGKTFIITWLTLLGNVVNLVLDPILIFGWGPFPKMGISGACLATGLGLLSQNLVLFILFLRRDNRKAFGTGKFSIHWQTLRDMIRIGFPEAAAVTLELGAWAAFYRLMSHMSAMHILIASVGQSLLFAFFFFGIGLEQGISSVCGNLIGANLKDEVARAFRSGLKIVGIFALGLLALFWFGGEWIVDLFLRNPENLESGAALASLTPEEFLQARTFVLESCFVIGAYIVLETIRCLLYGVLRAAGDTRFILLLSIISTWAILLVPAYFILNVWMMPAHSAFWIWLAYAFITTGMCYLRFARGSWRNREIISLNH